MQSTESNTVTDADNTRLALEAQIAHLYEVFSVYTVQHPLGGVNSYVYKEIQEALASTPIRLLKGEHLDRLTFSSMNTWSTTEEFKHFLPRILELLAFDAHSFSMASGSLIIGKFTYSDFANAQETEIELQSIRAYLRALWNYILEIYPSRSIDANRSSFCPAVRRRSLASADADRARRDREIENTTKRRCGRALVARLATAAACRLHTRCSA